MNNNTIKHIIITLLFISPVLQVYTQNIEDVSFEDWFKYKGGVNLNSTAYNAVGMENRRDPFFWGIDANLNFNLFNIIQVPLSAHYSKDNKTYNHPSYNHFGLSPSYKFITVHGGYRNMQFSSYSLSGLTFLGGGVEITPEDSWIKFSAMYGRFAKAVSYQTDSNRLTSTNPFDVEGYERWGYGGKLSIGRQKHNVELILFKAKDDPSSIPEPPSESGLKPMENLVVGFNTRNALTEKITLQTEYSLSALSRDIRVDERKMETFTYVNNMGNLFRPRYSTTVNSAWSLNLNYTGETFSTGIVYKHIDPDYQSLGTTYLSNDLENIFLNLKKSFFKNGLSLSGNIGYEHNNLDKKLTVTDKRVIGGANCNISLLNPFTISLNYSNFNANTQPVATTVQDTFKYAQVTENYGVNISYQYSGEKFTHNFTMGGTAQGMNTLNQNATSVIDVNTQMYNTNLNYNLYWAAIKLNIITSLNYTYFQPGEGMDKTKGWGPTAGLNKSFLKNKLRTGIMYSYQNNTTSANSRSNMNVIRFNSTYKVTSHQNLRLSMSMMFRQNNINNEEIQQEEYNARLTYSYVF